MSAIAGYYRLDGHQVQRVKVETMLESLAHRGPDGRNVWCRESVGLGHGMFHSTPESLYEELPFIDEHEDLTITADARIDNRDELIQALNLDASPQQQITDSQLILGAYKKWGDKCSSRLLGDFAFAIWDRRRQILFCSRDHMGAKPFYYHHSAKMFIFASEIKGLTSLAEVPRRLNELRVRVFLSDIAADNEVNTFYRDILRLPAAHSLIVGRGVIRKWRYWALDPSYELQLGSDQEYAEAFLEIFTEAVRCRLRSSSPVGVLMSGGLDSSSIACVARNLLAERSQHLHTFSAVNDTLPECDERLFINKTLNQGGFEPHFAAADQLSAFSDWSRMLLDEDAAYGGPNTFTCRDLYTTAGQQGVRVVLDGFDGDSTVWHGFSYLAELAQAGDWKAFNISAQAISRNFGASSQTILRSYGTPQVAALLRRGKWLPYVRQVKKMSRQFNAPRWWMFLQSIEPLWWLFKQNIKLLVPEIVYEIVRTALKKRTSFVNPAFARRINIRRLRRQHHKARLDLYKTTREQHYTQLSSGRIQSGHEVINKFTAAFSVEGRCPFGDKRLLEFCLALPSEQKFNHGWSRLILRHAMAGILPEEIQWRGGKTDLSPNFQYTLLTYDREVIERVITNNVGGINRFVDLSQLNELYRGLSSKNGKSINGSWEIWRAVHLALWLEHAGLAS